MRKKGIKMLKLHARKVFKGLLALAVLPLGALLALSAVELGGARGGLAGGEAVLPSSCATGIEVINTFTLPQADINQVRGLQVTLANAGQIESVSPAPQMAIPGPTGDLTYLFSTLRGATAVQITSCVASDTMPEVQSARWLLEQNGKNMVQPVALNQIQQEVRRGTTVALLPKQTTRYAVPCDLSDPTGTVLVTQGTLVTQQTQICLSSQAELARLEGELQQANTDLNSVWGMLFNRTGLTQKIAQLNLQITGLYELSPYTGTVAGIHPDNTNNNRIWVELDVEEAVSIP